MEIISNPEEVRRRCDDARRGGRRVGFVPTMGYLHRGHLSLVERAREQCDFVVLSIFVNPTQFGPTEDLERYPRDPEGDASKCREAGVALLFVPEQATMYPQGYQTSVEVDRVSRGLCGERRPGHFRGVCTVVTKLFNVVGPCTAVFGEKDYQQLLVVRRMARDLQQPVEIVGAPIVREHDGLAMSSRNAYLAPELRTSATCLFRALTAVRERVTRSSLPADQALGIAREIIDAAPGTRVDYIELRDAETLDPVGEARPGQTVMLLAVQLGGARLIDNMRL